MATAKKCDICGGLYEMYNVKRDSKNVNGFMFLNIDEFRKFYTHAVVDCCPGCMNSIKNHVDSLKKGVK